MLKAILSFSLVAIIGVISASSLPTTKTANPSNYESYASQYKVYSQSPSFTTTSSNTPTALNATGYPDSSPSSISDVTSNWAGYISTGNTYTAISGSWTVPSVTPDNEIVTADASWIGIGGVTSDDLIQVGTQNVVENGQVTTGTFYEQLPNSSETIPTVNVNPGDNITASIKEVSTGEWSISITDNTNGESYNNVVFYNSSESSAEWIEEAPSNETSVIPLDEFGSITFTGGSTTENGTTTTIAGSNAQAVTMDNVEGQALTATSAISNNGNFTISRTNASADDFANSESNFGFSSSNIPQDWSRHEPGLRGQIRRYYRNNDR